MKKSEFIELWVKALESGKYKQGKDYLVTSKGQYCCLGVACVIAQENNVMKIDITPDNEQVLPENLSKFLNLENLGFFINPIFHRNKQYKSLADLNDAGIKFKTIAKIIREQVVAKNFEKA